MNLNSKHFLKQLLLTFELLTYTVTIAEKILDLYIMTWGTAIWMIDQQFHLKYVCYKLPRAESLVYHMSRLEILDQQPL